MKHKQGIGEFNIVPHGAAGAETNALSEFNDEMGLTAGVSPSTAENVVAYCEAVNDEHPQLKFYGSEVVKAVRHTLKEPAPKII